MKTVEEIRENIIEGNIILTLHAASRMIERNISLNEIIEASRNVEIIEDYPDDKNEPSCLLLGFTNDLKAIHYQVSRVDVENIKIITIYYPSIDIWTDNFKERRKK